MGQELKKYIYFLLSISAFLIFTLILYYKFDQVIDLTKKEFINLKIGDARHNAKVIQNSLKSQFGLDHDFVHTMQKDGLYERVSSFLSKFIDDEYHYVYIIYRDEKGFFRYLADGSKDLEERGDFAQKFFPLEEEVWSDVFASGSSHYFFQEKINSLWITYLYPLNFSSTTPAFLVMDISTKAYGKIDTILKNLKHYLEYVLLFLSFIFIVILGLYFLIYKENRRNFIDPLTQVYNRNFLKQIENSLPLDKIAIAMIDLDFFKNINDVYGHDVGDIVLQKVAKTIQQNIRKEDILIRYGGEEFLLIAKKGSVEGIRSMISRIHTVVESTPVDVKGNKINVTLSIGLNEVPQNDQNIFDAIKKADMKLYQAKRNGRNRIEILAAESKGHENLISFEKITELIINKQIEIHYQPIVSIKQPQKNFYEALARLKEDSKLIFPGSFLPIISKTNYYIDFNVVLLEKILEVVDKERVSIAVNFNKSDFLDVKLSNIIEKIIVKNKELAKYLIFEILENEEVKLNDQLFFERIKRLKSYGVRIAIDDFGSGYSNLHYFLYISPDFIKIDGSIVKMLKTNRRAREIVKSIAIFARYIGATTVAEFIEDEETLEIVKSLGVEYMQGYYIAKPSNDLMKAESKKIFHRIYAHTA